MLRQIASFVKKINKQFDKSLEDMWFNPLTNQFEYIGGIKYEKRNKVKRNKGTVYNRN